MGDFQANFQRPDTGVNTVEGNVAGSRAAGLTKRRAIEQAEFEERKRKIKADSERGKLGIDAKFDADAGTSVEERDFRSRTVGLVTAEEFRRASAEVERARGRRGEGIFGEEGGDDNKHEDADGGGGGGGETAKTEDERIREEKIRKKATKKAMKEKKKRMAALSFAGDDEGLDDYDDVNDIIIGGRSNDESAAAVTDVTKTNNVIIEKSILKNPDVDTSFLPDRERELRAHAERERLRAEWLNKQRSIKMEMLEITYSYWDGTGHRRTVQCRKGDTIGRFLELVRCELAREFREMTNVSSDALLYVKEDLIIPQDVSFYDLIATRARGKSGPLFNFDVHDDVRIGAVDARIEKDESHPGKVVERRWYDRNKHIFPASRWEIYDPAKEYGTYTIHGGEVNAKGK
jgi:protein FAM50